MFSELLLLLKKQFVEKVVFVDLLKLILLELLIFLSYVRMILKKLRTVFVGL